MALGGCAIFKKGPTPEELVMQRTQALADDFLAGNVDKILDYISENFSDEHVQDKATLAKHIQEGKDSGKTAEFTQRIKDHHGQIDLKNAKVTVKDDTATVYPITASADEGSVTINLSFKKDRDKVWRVVGIKIEGI
jgi:hypothetical protein